MDQVTLSGECGLGYPVNVIGPVQPQYGNFICPASGIYSHVATMQPYSGSAILGVASEKTTDSTSVFVESQIPPLNIINPQNMQQTAGTIQVSGQCSSTAFPSALPPQNQTSLPVVSIEISGEVVGAPIQVPCVNGTFNQTIQLAQPEGVKNVDIIAKDGMRPNIQYSRQVDFSTSAPNLVINPLTAISTGSQSVSAQSNRNYQITVTGSTIQGSPITLTPLNGNVSTTLVLLAEGANAVTFSQYDQITQQTAVVNATYTKDTTPPDLSVTVGARAIHDPNVSFSGICESGHTVSLSLRNNTLSTNPAVSPSTFTCSPATLNCPTSGNFNCANWSVNTVLPSYVYGNHTITVISQDPLGNQNSQSANFDYQNSPPTAVLTGSSAVNIPYGSSSLTPTFDGSNSSDPNGTIVNYEFQLDGTAVCNGAASACNITFNGQPTPVTHQIRLEVTDNNGATHATTMNVTVQLGQQLTTQVVSRGVTYSGGINHHIDCPAGTTHVGGGVLITNYSGGSNWPDAVYPDPGNNRTIIRIGNHNRNNAWTGYAVCMKDPNRTLVRNVISNLVQVSQTGQTATLDCGAGWIRTGGGANWIIANGWNVIDGWFPTSSRHQKSVIGGIPGNGQFRIYATCIRNDGGYAVTVNSKTFPSPGGTTVSCPGGFLATGGGHQVASWSGGPQNTPNGMYPSGSSAYAYPIAQNNNATHHGYVTCVTKPVGGF